MKGFGVQRLLALGAVLTWHGARPARLAPPALLEGRRRRAGFGGPRRLRRRIARLPGFRPELGAALLADGGEGADGNVVSSPGSLLIALAMLRAGASGETAAEMDSVLGSPRQTAMRP